MAANLAKSLEAFTMKRQRGGGQQLGPRAVGSRAQVMHGVAHHTTGGLTQSQLTYNRAGRIVSKKASAAAKKANRLEKYKDKRFKKGDKPPQKGAGWAGDVGAGLAAAGGLSAATGIGAAAAPFLEAGAGMFGLGDAIFG